MIFKAKVRGVLKDVHYCDFCKENKQVGSLTLTGNIRYDSSYEKEGKEVVCRDCTERLRKFR